MPELHRLAPTINSWRSELLAYFDTGGVSNGPIETVNLSIKKVKRSGDGSRNLHNCRLRLLLHYGAAGRLHSQPHSEAGYHAWLRRAPLPAVRNDQQVHVERLPEVALARWRDAPFTYGEVGATAGTPPAGFRHLRRTRTLEPGIDFDRAARALMTWQVQGQVGLTVAASTLEVEPHAVVLLGIGRGRLSLSAPCRVAYVIDEADRHGFAYGTLPGHPESGEESFVLERRPDGLIDFRITAFSRPATGLAKRGGPITSWVQDHITTRYLRSLNA